MSENFEAPKSL